MAGKKNTIKQDQKIRFEKGTNNPVIRIMIADGKRSFAWGVREGSFHRFVKESETEFR